MGLLDVQIPQLISSEASFSDLSGLMRSNISSAEGQATAAQGFQQGEAALAFQAAHMRFVEAAGKINALLDIAGANLGEGAGTYVAQDAAGASDIASTTGMLA